MNSIKPLPNIDVLKENALLADQAAAAEKHGKLAENLQDLQALLDTGLLTPKGPTSTP